MPAHIKSSMFGCALTLVSFDLINIFPTENNFWSPFNLFLMLFYRVPITNGQLNMGTWQVRNNLFFNFANYSNGLFIIFHICGFMINISFF